MKFVIRRFHRFDCFSRSAGGRAEGEDGGDAETSGGGDQPEEGAAAETVRTEHEIETANKMRFLWMESCVF